MSVAIRIVLGYVFLWVQLKMWICIYLLCPCFKWNMQQWSADFSLYFSLFFSNCFSVCYDWRLLTALLETVLLFYLFLFFCLFLLIVALCVIAPRPMEQRLPSYSAFACQGSCLFGEACLLSLFLPLVFFFLTLLVLMVDWNFITPLDASSYAWNLEFFIAWIGFWIISYKVDLCLGLAHA